MDRDLEWFSEHGKILLRGCVIFQDGKNSGDFFSSSLFSTFSSGRKNLFLLDGVRIAVAQAFGYGRANYLTVFRNFGRRGRAPGRLQAQA
jgi:hypothetical protein